ncbi:hypothetical protein pb186bvf_020796 [Paramecium bursaria]
MIKKFFFQYIQKKIFPTLFSQIHIGKYSQFFFSQQLMPNDNAQAITFAKDQVIVKPRFKILNQLAEKAAKEPHQVNNLLNLMKIPPSLRRLRKKACNPSRDAGATEGGEKEVDQKIKSNTSAPQKQNITQQNIRIGNIVIQDNKQGQRPQRKVGKKVAQNEEDSDEGKTLLISSLVKFQLEQLDYLKFLVEKMNAIVTEEDYLKKTALRYAVQLSAKTYERTIFQFNSMPKIKFKEYKKNYRDAILDLVKLFISRGASINAKDSLGLLRKRQTDLIQYFIEKCEPQFGVTDGSDNNLLHIMIDNKSYAHPVRHNIFKTIPEKFEIDQIKGVDEHSCTPLVYMINEFTFTTTQLYNKNLQQILQKHNWLRWKSTYRMQIQMNLYKIILLYLGKIQIRVDHEFLLLESLEKYQLQRAKNILKEIEELVLELERDRKQHKLNDDQQYLSFLLQLMSEIQQILELILCIDHQNSEPYFLRDFIIQIRSLDVMRLSSPYQTLKQHLRYYLERLKYAQKENPLTYCFKSMQIRVIDTYQRTTQVPNVERETRQSDSMLDFLIYQNNYYRLMDIKGYPTLWPSQPKDQRLHHYGLMPQEQCLEREIQLSETQYMIGAWLGQLQSQLDRYTQTKMVTSSLCVYNKKQKMKKILNYLLWILQLREALKIFLLMPNFIRKRLFEKNYANYVQIQLLYIKASLKDDNNIPQQYAKNNKMNCIMITSLSRMKQYVGIDKEHLDTKMQKIFSLILRKPVRIKYKDVEEAHKNFQQDFSLVQKASEYYFIVIICKSAKKYAVQYQQEIIRYIIIHQKNRRLTIKNLQLEMQTYQGTTMIEFSKETLQDLNNSLKNKGLMDLTLRIILKF